MNGNTGSAWHNELQNQRQYGQAMMQMQSGEDVDVGISRQPIGGGNHYESPHFRPGQYGNGSRYPRNSVQRNYQEQQGSEGNHESARLTGHQAFLKGLMRSGALVRLVTSIGDEYEGTIKGFDDTTISLRIECATPENPNAYQNRVFFKRQLIEFAPVVEGVTFS